jgi:hypothetical protein
MIEAENGVMRRHSQRKGTDTEITE